MAGKILAQGLGGVVLDEAEGVKWLDLCVRNPDATSDTDDEDARELLDRLIVSAGWDVVGEGKYRAFQWQQAMINTENGEPGSASELVLRDLGQMDGDAAFDLGIKLNDGDDSPADFEKALRCFKRAAEFDITEAHFHDHNHMNVHDWKPVHASSGTIQTVPDIYPGYVYRFWLSDFLAQIRVS